MPETTPPQEPKTAEAGVSTPPKKRRRWPWIVLFALLAVGGWLFQRHRAEVRARSAQAPPPKAVPVRVATANKGDIEVSVDALGTVTPVYTVTVTGRVQGQIMRVSYHEGQLVHVGDPLLEIDPRPFQAVLLQEQGQLAHDRAVLQQARIDLWRYRAASTQNAIARQQLEDQEQIVAQAEGTVKADEGLVANAEVNLSYCDITAPINGRVGLRLVDPGNIVQTNNATALVTIAQVQPITVIFSVAQDYLPQIQAPLQSNDPPRVDAFDTSQQKRLATGTLLALDNMVDTTTGTIRIRALFPNQDGVLYPNQFVNARLFLATLRDQTLIPNAAVQRNAQGTFVYLIEGGQTARVKTVTVKATQGSVTAVDGVSPGEVVVTTGFDKLKDNAQVTVRESTSTPNPGDSMPDAGPAP
jgi:multidrug efflux system membrane fusion protein